MIKAENNWSIAVLDQQNIGFDLDYSPIQGLGRLQLHDAIKNDELASFMANSQPTIAVANRSLFSPAVLEAGKAAGLRLICLTATGTNTVDLPAAAALGIAVCNIVGYSTNAVAQHTLALALTLINQIANFSAYVQGQTWAGSPVFTWLQPVITELSGKTWGIIGLGSIGRRVAELAQALGCQVQYTSISGTNRPETIPQVSREQLLQTSDVISIHAALTAASQGFITYPQLCLMKPSAILINVGRGAIINEAELARALQENRLAGAGLDVLWPEPPQPDNPLLPLLASNRLVITPHVAWAAIEARQRAVAETAANIAS